MALWGNTDVSSNAVKYKVLSNSPNTGAQLFNNTTIGYSGPGTSAGVFAMDNVETNVGGRRTGAHAGWVLVKLGTGPVTSFTVTANGTRFGNGETLTVSASGIGMVNATGTITTNASGNAVSVAVSNGGFGFANVSSATVTFNREKHLISITVAGTPTGFSTGDIIQVGNGTINATASIVANASGGFATGNVTITSTGLWATTKANTNLSFAVTNASGGSTGGSGATFTGAIANSTGGTVTFTLGGRAGRTSYETLVATGSIQGDSEDLQFPDS
jgi:hypothetical protein